MKSKFTLEEIRLLRNMIQDKRDGKLKIITKNGICNLSKPEMKLFNRARKCKELRVGNEAN